MALIIINKKNKSLEKSSKFNIWHISDTHGYHELLKIPNNIDIVIHSGDSTNSKNRYKNQVEFQNFLIWFKLLPIKHKILIAGNHDATLFYNTFNIKSDLKLHGITYLENNLSEIEGLKIYGSPIVPTFGNWYFMKNRAKMYKIWENIPDNIDILITHTPPKGILDLSYGRDNKLEYCGCNALKKRIFDIQPKLMLFGHIHNTTNIINAGILKLSKYKTIFSNGSVVTDGKFGKLSSNGNILEI